MQDERTNDVKTLEQISVLTSCLSTSGRLTLTEAMLLALVSAAKPQHKNDIKNHFINFLSSTHFEELQGKAEKIIEDLVDTTCNTCGRDIKVPRMLKDDVNVCQWCLTGKTPANENAFNKKGVDEHGNITPESGASFSNN